MLKFFIMNKPLEIFPLKLFFDKSKFSNEDGDCVGGREIDGRLVEEER
jgi:hypothetical protein